MTEPGTLQRLLKNRVALAALALLVLVAVTAIVGPIFLPEEYGEVSALQFAPPSLAHPFGTDLNGRDVLHRTMAGARVSLLVGVCGACISLVVGVTYGLVSGYAGGRIDSAMMRLVEILYAIPRLVIIIVFIAAFDAPFKNWMVAHGLKEQAGFSKIVILILSLGLIEWLTMARIVRGQVLALKSRQFIAAARSLGQSQFKIITRHLLPNLLGVVIVYLTLAIPAVILDESFLSFLGLGVDAPQASWGSLLNEGAQVINPIRSNWWLLVFPAAVMSATLLALNFLGDGLRDALDPRARR